LSAVLSGAAGRQDAVYIPGIQGNIQVSFNDFAVLVNIKGTLSDALNSLFHCRP